MAKWTYNPEDLVVEVKAGGEYIEQSGAYEVTIDEVIEKTNTTGTEQISFKFTTTGGQKGTVYIVYIGKDGKPIDFKVAVLNHICGLMKVTPENIEKIKGRKIGMFLKAKLSQDGKYINTDLEGVYDADKKLTTKELKEDATEPKTYNKFVAKYEKETPLERTSNNTSSNTSVKKVQVADDEFPF